MHEHSSWPHAKVQDPECVHACIRTERTVSMRTYESERVPCYPVAFVTHIETRTNHTQARQPLVASSLVVLDITGPLKSAIACGLDRSICSTLQRQLPPRLTL